MAITKVRLGMLRTSDGSVFKDTKSDGYGINIEPVNSGDKIKIGGASEIFIDTPTIIEKSTGSQLVLKHSDGNTSEFSVNSSGDLSISNLLAASIPDLDFSKITTGTIPTSRGGTGLTTIPAGRIMYGNDTSAVSSSASLTYDGTTFTVLGSPSANTFRVGATGSGDSVLLSGLAAGSGAVIAGLNSAMTDYEPLRIIAEDFSISLRDGVGTNTPRLYLTNEGELITRFLASRATLTDDTNFEAVGMSHQGVNGARFVTAGYGTGTIRPFHWQTWNGSSGDVLMTLTPAGNLSISGAFTTSNSIFPTINASSFQGVVQHNNLNVNAAGCVSSWATEGGIRGYIGALKHGASTNTLFSNGSGETADGFGIRAESKLELGISTNGLVRLTSGGLAIGGLFDPESKVHINHGGSSFYINSGDEFAAASAESNHLKFSTFGFKNATVLSARTDITDATRSTTGLILSSTYGSSSYASAAININCNNGSGSIDFFTGVASSAPTEKMKLTATGDLGLSTTPSAWSTFRALQIYNGAIAALTGQLDVSVNSYYDGTNYRYINTGGSARYTQTTLGHYWILDASGTAGDIAPLSYKMALIGDNLGIGTTTPLSKLHVSGVVSSFGANQGFISVGVGTDFTNFEGLTCSHDGANGARFISSGVGTGTIRDFVFATWDGFNVTELMRLTASANLTVESSVTAKAFWGVLNSPSSADIMAVSNPNANAPGARISFSTNSTTRGFVGATRTGSGAASLFGDESADALGIRAETVLQMGIGGSLKFSMDSSSTRFFNADFRIDQTPAGTAGAATGTYLVINLNGTNYKVALLANA